MADHKLIFEGNSRENLRYHELNTFLLLMEYFDTDVICINPAPYKTADIRVNGVEWEVKSPKGDDKNTIENILHKASRQSTNVVLDLSRTKMSNTRALSRTKYYLRDNKHYLQRLLIILKDGTIIDLKDDL